MLIERSNAEQPNLCSCIQTRGQCFMMPELSRNSLVVFLFFPQLNLLLYPVPPLFVMLPSELENASRKGKKKALLIAVTHVEGIDGYLPQANRDAQQLKDFLINQHDYAEDDIVLLLHDCEVEESLWPSRKNIINKIKWLVEDLGEHDKLVFYYSGHGGQTTCRHNSEVDGKDEAIYGYTGHKIIDNVLRRQLVGPVLKKKGCQLFALFDCCHSETILDLKHGSCCFRRSLPLLKSSITSDRASRMDGRLSKEITIALPVSVSRQSKDDPPVSPPSRQSIAVRYMNRTLRNFRNYISKMLAGLFDRKLASVDRHVQTASVKGHLLIDTTPVSQPDLSMSPNRIVMSPIQFQEGFRRCDITENEENEGHIVCLSACRDNQMASDDNETGGTLTKFFMSSLKKNSSSISYKDLLDDIQSQVTDLQARRAAQMQGQPLEVACRRWRQPGVLSEIDLNGIRRGGSPQEPRITSNRPFDLNNTFSI